MLYPTVPLPRTPPWAPRNLLSSLVSPHKPGRLPTPGAVPPALLPQPPPGCLPARLPPPCRSGRRQQECILPSPLEPRLLSLLLLLDLLAHLPEVPTRPRPGSILPPTCPSRSFRGHMGVQQSRQPPLLVSDLGGPCLLGGGDRRWGANILLLVCRIHPPDHIPLLPRHQGPHQQCHGVRSHQDLGDLRHRPRFHHLLDPTRLLDCTQRHPILTKCHLHLLGRHPCLVDLIPTVEPEAS